jgi:hypothetical protein
MISFLSAQDKKPFNANARIQFPPEIGNDLLSDEQQLILGLAFLNRRHPMLRDDGYSYYLRELLKVTGFSADEAKKIIEKYKNNPEKYLVILQKTKLSLVGSNE